MEERATYLFERYVSGEATAAERNELFALLRSNANDPHILSLIDRNYAEFTPENNPFSEETEAAMLRAIFEASPASKVRPLWLRIAAAACLLIGISIGGYFLLHQVPGQQTIQIGKNDIAPGHDQATLTLAGGQKIILTKELSGKLANQGGTLIQVNAKREIAYTAGTTTANTQLTYNTLSTKNGEQSPYPLVLADGSKVWLNAASSITFPTTFNGRSREVKITGEAYFEVAHNAAKPFKVTTNGQTVEVLGTHFNINAYHDEPALKTTLFKGAVKVTNGKASARLKPGQQSVIVDNGPNSSLNVLNDVNTDRVLAWKNGKFSFDDADIKTVMRQIGRWYNLEIQYEGKVQPTVFSGEIYRNVNLSKALEILGFTRVNFRIEGRKIIITP
jgi:transmembrane sensor